MPTGIVTVLATDTDDIDALKALVDTHGGVPSDDPGVAIFSSAVSACDCAIDLQTATGGGAPVGLHVGESADDPATVAQALCRQAGAGQILASELVVTLAGTRRSFEAVPAVTDPVAARELRWQPVTARPALPAQLARELDDSPFSGRTAELDRLRAAWARAARDGFAVVFVAGEAGIGKTRLVAELASTVIADGAPVRYGACAEDVGISYQPFIEALGALPRSDANVAGPDPAAERRRLFDAVVAAIGEVATPSGLLLVLDDLHWAAPSTLLLLQHLIESTGLERVLVVGTFRDTDLAPPSRLLEIADRGETITLDGLDAAAVAALVDDDEIAARLVSSTGGNPYFVREMAAHLSDGGLPESVRDVALRRVDRLSPDTNRVLALAAVVGREFSAEVLELAEEGAVVDEALEEATAAKVVGAVDDGSRRFTFCHAVVRESIYAGLTRTRRSVMHRRVAQALESLPDAPAGALAHHLALAGSAAAAKAAHYAGLAAAEALHVFAWEEAAAILERALAVYQSGAVTDPENHAQLLIALGDVQHRLGQVDTAKESAAVAAEAARALGRADLLGHAAAVHARWAHFGRPDTTSIALVEEALAALGGDEPPLRARLTTLAAYYRAWSESRGADVEPLAEDALRLARAVGDPAVVVDALFVRAVTLRATPRIAEQVALAEELLALGQTDLRARAFGYQIRGAMRLVSGDAAGFETDTAEVERLGDALNSWQFRAFAAEWRTLQALIAGRFADVRRLTKRMLDVAGGDPDFFTAWAAQMFWVAREQGELRDMITLVEDSLERMPSRVARCGVALAYADLGELDDARRHYEIIAADDFAMVQRDLAYVAALAMLAETAVRLGHVEGGRWLRERLAPFAGTIAVVGYGAYCVGAVDRFLGMLAALDGRPEEADDRYRRALALEEAMDAPPLVARTKTWWAASLARIPGRHDDAMALAGEARELGAALGMTGLA